MRLLTNLLFKVTLSSMVLTAPAMITGRAKYDGDSRLKGREVILPFYSSAVIVKFIEHPSLTVVPTYSAEEKIALPVPAMANVVAAPAPAPTVTVSAPAPTVTVSAPAPAVAVPVPVSAVTAPVSAPILKAPAPEEKEAADNGVASSVAVKAAELRMVISQAVTIYSNMELENQGLDEKAFEYAWRGYHNLLKKGLIQKRTVLSICDFSQSCCSKRMYVIDVQHRKLLYRTFVAHGQNSGEEYATTFSNEPESFKSSLGFYVTDRVYYGRNGLSLRLKGVDSGYNDLALKRKIVLHGSAYVGDKYMENFGTLGTSLGCPALPSSVSGRIIRAVRNGSCLFIYHPTQQYLENSPIING
jgi:L,D-transpeptidase catalytic domain